MIVKQSHYWAGIYIFIVALHKILENLRISFGNSQSFLKNQSILWSTDSGFYVYGMPGLDIVIAFGISNCPEVLF